MKKVVEYKLGDTVGNCIFLEMRPTKIVGESKSHKRCALFRCKCGNEFEAIISQLINGNTKSCGCLTKQAAYNMGRANAVHGYRKHRLYKTWTGMIRRCTDPNDFGYYNYGKRGIKVCDRWLSIENFISDMYPFFKEGLELDRIDVNGNYDPANCRWITRKQNMNNTRRSRYIEYKGVRKTVSEWADELNIPYKRLLARLNNWDVEKSFTYKNK